MKSIKVTILGKQYPLKVADSEVDNMEKIAQFVDEKFKLYKRELNKQPESTIMVLAALSIAEELFELRQSANEIHDNENKLMESVNYSLEKLLDDIS